MLDPDFLDAMGHPVRLRALVLFERAPGTADDLAADAGVAGDVAEHHVRRLAAAGLIEQVGTRGGQRLWRPRATGWTELRDRLAAAVEPR